MHRLAPGVDPGVGATGSDDVERLVEKPGQRFFHDLLHRQGVDLALPTGVGGASIGENQAVDHFFKGR